MERRRDLREIGTGGKPLETMDSEKQPEGFEEVEGGRLGEPGGGDYGGHGLHGALGVVPKQ